ncbi:hypothetical protein Tco_0725405 [Tanacetum coccineum]|uniref:Uncharacterized protein n=1 Tax=Tanacetum coccineum TaxID=301880 RepID=A0ABQ4YCS8_9ASTR
MSEGSQEKTSMLFIRSVFSWFLQTGESLPPMLGRTPDFRSVSPTVYCFLSRSLSLVDYRCSAPEVANSFRSGEPIIEWISMECKASAVPKNPGHPKIMY